MNLPDFAAMHESGCGPKPQILRRANSVPIGEKADVAQTPSIGRKWTLTGRAGAERHAMQGICRIS
jgi:hypothetical protein